MTKNKTCNVCGIVLDSKNCWPSCRKKQDHICKECKKKRNRLWYKANPEKAKAKWTREDRKRGHRPFNENKECGLFLGVHIAEQILSQAFKDVKRMPMNNPGYDVICNRDKLIDIKSSCQQKDGRWGFTIRRNPIADFFLCIAFDNREDLNPLHAWLLPGNKFNRYVNIGISPSTIHKWDEYRLDISKISDCCDRMR